MSLVNIGYGNYIIATAALAVLNSGSESSSALVQNARDNGTIIDATEDRPARSLILLEGGRVALSSITTETLRARFNVLDGAGDAA